MKKTLKAWCLLLALGLSLAACSGDGPDSDSDSTDGPSGSVLWDAVFGAPTLDPHRLSQIVFGAVMNGVYDTLVTFEGSDVDEISPLLAESWEVSEDATTYTFTLRQDAVFADGKPVTSADVLFSFNRLQNLQSLNAFRADGLSFEAPDDYTFVITADEPKPAMLFELTHYAYSVINSEAARAAGAVDTVDAVTADTAQATLDTTSLGSGPYVIDTVDPGVRVVLAANENYWGDTPPAFEQIVLRNAPSETQLLNIQAGETDIAMEISGEQASTVTSPDYNVVSTPAVRQLFVFMNTDPAISPITSNKDFQEAVRYGLDYDSILELAGPDATRTSFVPPTVPGALPESEFPQRDLERARAALQRSGLGEPTLEYFYASDNPQLGLAQDPIAERIQANLAEVGITIELVPLPQASLFPRISEQHEIPFGQWAANRPPDPSQFLIFCPDDQWGERLRMTAEDEPGLAALCQTAATALGDDILPAYEEMQRGLQEDGPIVQLFNPTQQVISRSSITGADYAPAYYLNIRSLGHAG